MARSALTIASMLEAADSHHLAITDTSRRGLSYGNLRTLIGRLHDALARTGLESNDTVAVALHNGPETAALLTGLLSYCRVAPLNPRLTQCELAFALRDVGARAIVTKPDVRQAVRAANECGIACVFLAEQGTAQPGTFELHSEARMAPRASHPARPETDGTALLLHTSGTTARPKLVPLTQLNLTLAARGVADTLDLSPADSCLSVMPVFHVHGLVAGLLASLAVGGTVCCARGFRPAAFFAGLVSSKATWYSAVPTIHHMIVARAAREREALRRHQLRLIRSCSSRLSSSLWAQLQSVFQAPVLNAYGMTEAAHQITGVKVPGSSHATVGVSSGPDVGIMDSVGHLLPARHVGEVVVRGPQIMSGYLQPAEVNASAFTGGWFRTGDEGFTDARGSLVLSGRLKEMINCGGEKVSPYEVEDALMHHPGVEQALAFALPDSRLGESVAVAIVVRGGWQMAERDLLRLARHRLARHKLPRRIVILSEIPRSDTGKIQRIGLAQRLDLKGD